MYYLVWFVLINVLISCAGENIFNAAPTSTSAASIVMPSPVSVKISTVTGKIYVVNSDGKVEYNTGSFAALSMDATDPAAPVLSADTLVSMEQFSGDMALDAQFAYVTNRRSAEDSSSATDDALFKIQIDDGSLATVAETTVGPNPFGIALSAGELFVVSDSQVDRLAAADLSLTASVDLSGLSGVSAGAIEGVAVDAANAWLAVTNRGSDLLIIDTTDNSLDYEVEGPNNTRGIAIGNGRLYALEGTPPSLLVMDLSGLGKQTSVTLIDDSSILIGTVAVGDDPCQIALDLANSRAYVTNAGSDDVSVIDTDLLVEVARISLDENDIAAALDDGRDPCGIDVGTFNGASFVVVGNYDSNNLSVINAATLNVVATFP